MSTVTKRRAASVLRQIRAHLPGAREREAAACATWEAGDGEKRGEAWRAFCEAVYARRLLEQAEDDCLRAMGRPRARSTRRRRRAA